MSNTDDDADKLAYPAYCDAYRLAFRHGVARLPKQNDTMTMVERIVGRWPLPEHQRSHLERARWHKFVALVVSDPTKLGFYLLPQKERRRAAGSGYQPYGRPLLAQRLGVHDKQLGRDLERWSGLGYVRLHHGPNVVTGRPALIDVQLPLVTDVLVWMYAEATRRDDGADAISAQLCRQLAGEFLTHRTTVPHGLDWHTARDLARRIEHAAERGLPHPLTAPAASHVRVGPDDERMPAKHCAFTVVDRRPCLQNVYGTDPLCAYHRKVHEGMLDPALPESPIFYKPEGNLARLRQRQLAETRRRIAATSNATR